MTGRETVLCAGCQRPLVTAAERFSGYCRLDEGCPARSFRHPWRAVRLAADPTTTRSIHADR